MEDHDYPALFKAADKASISAQNHYFNALKAYIFLLVIAALVSFTWPKDTWGAISSASLFLITLGILVWLKMKKPEDIWYNGRAVAESVKTRTWRWVTKSSPYDAQTQTQAQAHLISDLRGILEQNQSLSQYMDGTDSFGEAITQRMITIHNLPWDQRLDIYKEHRINEQLAWYSNKSAYNKKLAKRWFITSLALHSAAALMLLYTISDPLISLPIAVIATAASTVLTWVQTKKYGELRSAYALAAHEISFVRAGATSIASEQQLSEFIINSEAAFSREHTQWAARRNG